MQIDKKFHILDTENGRLLKGVATRAEADEIASNMAKENATKMFAVVEVQQYFRIKTEVESLTVDSFEVKEETTE